MSEPTKMQTNIILIACLTSLWATPPATSQQTQNSGKIWGANRNLNTNPIQPLKDAPEFPDLPPYSGKAKFVRGYIQPTDTGWISYQVSLLVKESPEEVKDWYVNAFNMYQWKILNNSKRAVTANGKTGHMCTVIINDTKQPGFKSQISVLYNVAPAKQAHH
jgi:hypothetical protein